MPLARRALLAFLAALALLPSSSHAQQPPDLLVFAAASLKNALDAIVSDYQAAHGKRVAASYAASSALARQIEGGAPADVFISADLDWMDYLQERKLVRADTRTALLGNRIVLIAPAEAQAAEVSLRPGSLPATLNGGRLAMASVATVPAGRYGKAALEHLGLWAEVAPRIAEAENVRAALAFVARGEAPLGIVYETDASAEPRVKIVARFPEGSHPPIVYPAAALAASKRAETDRFLKALRASAATAIFRREGFTPLD